MPRPIKIRSDSRNCPRSSEWRRLRTDAKLKAKKKKAQFYHLQFDAAETIGNLLKILRERQQLKMPL